MNLQEINFEQAKLLKQAGFVEHTTKFFDKNGVLTGSLPVNHNLHKDRFSCVTVALAIQWLRERKDKDISIEKHTNGLYFFAYYINQVFHGRGFIAEVSSGPYQKREEAVECALNRALEILTTTP